MARQLIFQIDKEYPFSVTKLDRDKLYGWKEVVAFDSEGRECVRVDIDTTGSFIIPKGGKALGVLDKQGNWVERKELKAVHKDGTPAEPIPSSFDQPTKLEKTVTVEEFLDHCITAVYILQVGFMGEGLLEQVKSSGQIYTFTFNYRAGYEGSPAFLVESEDNLFMLVGYPVAFEFIGLEQVAEFSVEDEEEAEEEELDFSMM